MSTRRAVTLVCDICEADGAESHTLGLDSAVYAIDLCFDHQLELAETLSPFLEVAVPLTVV